MAKIGSGACEGKGHRALVPGDEEVVNADHELGAFRCLYGPSFVVSDIIISDSPVRTVYNFPLLLF